MTPARFRKHAPLTTFHSLDKIFPLHLMHMIASAARAGKTILMYQIMDWLTRGEPVFGHSANSAKFCYVSVAHPLSECLAMAERAGLPDVPIISMAGKPKNERSFENAIELAKRKVKHCEILLLDGIPGLSPVPVGDYNGIASFLSDCINTVEHEDLIVIASGRFSKPRAQVIDSFIGSTAWTEYTSTQIIIERTDNPAHRRVTVSPRGMPDQMYYYKFNSRGMFDTIENPAIPRQHFFEQQLFSHPPGSQITTALAKEYGSIADLRERTVELYLTKLARDGRLIRIKNGLYQIAQKH